VLAVLAATQHRGATVDTSLVGKTTTPASGAPAPTAGGDAFSNAAAAVTSNSVAQTVQNQAVPLAQ